MAMHENNLDHPDEPDHPHIHILVKAINVKGKRLNIRKQDLRYLRERFAVLAKKTRNRVKRYYQSIKS